MVKVVPLDPPVAKQVRRVGFMNGEIKVPDDFDRMHEDESASSSKATIEIVARHPYSGMGRRDFAEALAAGARVN
jgi:hypothetical protein